MLKISKLIALIVFLSIISACGTNNVERSRVVEEAAVYFAIINEQLEVPFTYLMGDPILIENNTAYDTVDDDYLYDSVSSLDTDTLANYKEVNKESQTLDLPLSLNKPYEYITLPSDEKGWAEFEQNYPNAISIVTISKIGFNDKLDQAFVYMSYYCGNECGVGNFYFLVRKGNTWKVESTIGVWIS